MGRLYAKQGRERAAQHLVAEIHSWFTEGLDTADLKEAGAFLANADSQ